MHIAQEGADDAHRALIERRRNNLEGMLRERHFAEVGTSPDGAQPIHVVRKTPDAGAVRGAGLSASSLRQGALR